MGRLASYAIAILLLVMSYIHCIVFSTGGLRDLPNANPGEGALYTVLFYARDMS